MSSNATRADVRSAVKTGRIGYRSSDGKTQIRALTWEPEKNPGIAPAGIVQIVHGMSEHVERYDEFARYLVSRGYIVCANDHIGHGESVADPSEWGCLPSVGGKEVLINDVHELRKTVASRYARQTPYIMFGHSMGSFIVRAYLARFAEGLAAAVICGTGQQPLLLSKFGNLVARRIAASKGDAYKSTFLDGLGAGSFAKKIDNPRTEFDWISTDDAVVDAYIADESCGVMFSAGGYATLTDLTGEVVTAAAAGAVPADLPLLFIAGALDPVGDMGKGVERAVEQYRRAGVETVDLKLYEGMRHEILNEPGRAEVYADVADWIDEHRA
ncbi:alpha/beta fold hydrolase [Raoultibacter timonensis]|uniref:Alpha/beta hydrolase n=1 Tax=Raoultibacter timonensis TaxID=1907662 RepID=A0ABM7WHQ3_9ACTN|nr:alpha/beta hydrolase [Raoultibacter timonensis]BDE95794.1 alpha/beta hydrolase [Raoultibacter timonensis]BDF50398.1 alpha/beta hydrolase [Raoultibacter timonensis]